MFAKMGINKNMDDGLNLEELARVIDFIINTNKNTTIPEIGIKNINNQGLNI